MKMLTVQPIANGYALYCGKNYLMMFNRKENAVFVANMIEQVKEKDIKSYVYQDARKNK